MLLLNVKSTKHGTYIEVQNGATAYRSCALEPAEIERFCVDVVMAMLASRGLPQPLLSQAIPEPKEIKRPFPSGIGLSDDHKQLVLVKSGKVTVLEEGPRHMIANALKVAVGRALDNGNYLKGEWT